MVVVVVAHRVAMRAAWAKVAASVWCVGAMLETVTDALVERLGATLGWLEAVSHAN